MLATSSLKRTDEVAVPSWPLLSMYTAVPLETVTPFTPARNALVWLVELPMRIVLDSFPGAVLPMSMLLPPLVMLKPAERPSAMLLDPEVFPRALAPTAVLLLPVDTPNRA